MRESYPVIRVHSDYSGRLWARDGVILCFFMRRPYRDIAPAVWRALQTYMRAIPPGALAWYVDDEGDTLPLDDTGWAVVREYVLGRPQHIACRVELMEHDGEAGGYNFEYHGRQLDDPRFSGDTKLTCGIAFSLPTEYLLEHGPARVRALALELARELPFSFGYASFAVVAPGSSWYPVRMELRPYLQRFLGLDIYHVEDTSWVIGTGARGAYWLTFLGQPLLGQLGGPERLRQQLPFPDVSFHELSEGRLLLTLGEWPSALDTQEGVQAPHLRALARLLEPYLPEENISLYSLMDPEPMYRWLRRLCP